MVKLADTLQAMSDFPVAMASGINIVKEDDTEKDLQQMYEDGELGGESMPMPLSANMLLVSENDETSGDLIWSQIDKSEVGSVPLICTEQEWEDLDPKPVEGTEVIITDDEDGVNKELIDDDTISVDTTWSSSKIDANLSGYKIRIGVVTVSTDSGGWFDIPTGVKNSKTKYFKLIATNQPYWLAHSLSNGYAHRFDSMDILANATISATYIAFDSID